MTREEVIENLGTIARSGTRRFLEALRDKGAQRPELIGQFGVGFYSSFMVAERIVVETRKAGTDGGVCWTSRGDGEFTLEPTSGLERGTRITLDLKPLAEGEEDAQDFADAFVLRELVKKYSDFVEWPILMPSERLPDERVLRRRPGPGHGQDAHPLRRVQRPEDPREQGRVRHRPRFEDRRSPHPRRQHFPPSLRRGPREQRVLHEGLGQHQRREG